VAGGGGADSRINATGNIFITDVDSWKSTMVATINAEQGAATTRDVWSNNVYILLKGTSMVWSVTDSSSGALGTTTIFQYPQWQSISGQDQNSLYIDLRKDPRGLKAIFLDPENGNYTLANTIEGNKVRALGAGMKTPLQCFLKKPTYEQGAEMIKNGKVLSVNDCRNPCQDTKVKMTSPFTPDANGIITVCKDYDISFKGSGNYTQNDTYYHQSDLKARYLWWFSDGTDTSGTNLHTVRHRFTDTLNPTNVRLQMVDENGCSFDTTYRVKVVTPPVKTGLVKDTSLCTGQTLQLQVPRNEANGRYSWSTGDTTNTISVTEAGKYWVQVQNTGCKVADTIRVTNKTPVSVTLGPDTTYCTSKPILLTAAGKGNIKSYEWNTGATSDTLRINNPGTYIVTAKDYGVCLARDTINVTANPVNAFTLPNDTTICEGSSYTIKVSNKEATSLTWNDGTTGFSRLIKPGVYNVVASRSGCTKRDTIIVNSTAIPVVKLKADTTICNGYVLPLSVSYPGASYLWSTGSRENAIGVTAKGAYWVQATSNGCSYKATMNLQVQNCGCNVTMANAFSPNGDGINDVIKPTMYCYPKEFNMSVFNRYGQLVYSTTSYSVGWNGEINGQPAAMGTYYYVITLRNEGEYNKPVTGSVTLLR
jgi:gliding motility-associated-like protein